MSDITHLDYKEAIDLEKSILKQLDDANETIKQTTITIDDLERFIDESKHINDPYIIKSCEEFKEQAIEFKIKLTSLQLIKDGINEQLARVRVVFDEIKNKTNIRGSC